MEKAPIREALIDVQVVPSSPDVQRLKELVKSFGKPFERISDLWQAAIGMGFQVGGSGNTTTASHEIVGQRVDSDDGKYVIQCRVNGFSFSRLPPYENWEKFSSCAKIYLSKYLEASAPLGISRLAVRYINEIILPLPIVDFNNYFTASPNVPAALPQTVMGYLQRTVIVDSASTNIATVVQAIDESSSHPALSLKVFLDIDVHRLVDLQPSEGEKAWTVLEDLRKFKNDVFFEHLQEKAVEMFE